VGAIRPFSASGLNFGKPPTVAERGRRLIVRFGGAATIGRMAKLGANLPVKQHSERLLSGMAQQPPDDRLGSIPAV
jgi:hypothetical protein